MTEEDLKAKEQEVRRSNQLLQEMRAWEGAAERLKSANRREGVLAAAISNLRSTAGLPSSADELLYDSVCDAANQRLEELRKAFAEL